MGDFMNEFDEKKLESFDNTKTSSIVSRLKGMNGKILLINSLITQIKVSEDDDKILNLCNDINHKLRKLNMDLDDLPSIFYDLEIYSEEKYSTESEKVYSLELIEKYNRFKNIDFEKYIQKSKMKQFIPRKGTRGYCDCKNYYELSRVEIARMLKSDLHSKFPNCDFSVTSREDYTDRVTVRLKKVPSEYVLKSSHVWVDYKITNKFHKQLLEVCKEYSPRVEIYISIYCEDCIIEGDLSEV